MTLDIGTYLTVGDGLMRINDVNTDSGKVIYELSSVTDRAPITIKMGEDELAEVIQGKKCFHCGEKMRFGETRCPKCQGHTL